MKNLGMVLMGKVYSKDKKARPVLLQEWMSRKNLHGKCTKKEPWCVQNQACQLLDLTTISLIFEMSSKLVNHHKLQ